MIAARELGGLDALVNNAGILGPSPQPHLLAYPPEALERVYRANVIAPLAVLQAVQDQLKAGARIVNITSDAGLEAYEGWGGYGSSKAALEQLSAVLAVENPSWRIYWVDPGDMHTQMHQAAFSGEDISDRPLPEESVPGLIAVLDGDWPSGRYAASEPPEARDLARDQVRLMVSHYTDDRVEHTQFSDILDYLDDGDVLVINTSGTLNAALEATRSDEAQLELHLSTHLPTDLWVVEVRQPEGTATRPYLLAAAGETLYLPGAWRAMASPFATTTSSSPGRSLIIRRFI